MQRFFEGIKVFRMSKRKVFTFLLAITLVTFLIRVNLHTLYNSHSLEENFIQQKTDGIYQQLKNNHLKVVHFWATSRQAQIPQKLLFIQTPKNFDAKFLLTSCQWGESVSHRPPLSLNISSYTHSKHPYTHLSRIYYLYTLKKILI